MDAGLIAPAVVGMSALSGDANPLRFPIASAAVAAIAAAVAISIRRGVVLETEGEEPAGDPAEELGEDRGRIARPDSH